VTVITEAPKPVAQASARLAVEPWKTIAALIAGDTAPQKEHLKLLLERPLFEHKIGQPLADFRQQVYDWMADLCKEGLGRMPYPIALGGGGDMKGFLASMETLAGFDLSLIIKFGVNFGLFAGSVFHLGSDYHHQKYLRRTFDLSLPGAFAMTETGHGSNVRSLETVARYEPSTREFVIHTPNPAARKDYIGNAAQHAHMATVFAQLEIGSERYGVHAFLVPIRDEDNQGLPGITIEDCGEKVGLNGVDNGRLTFDHVRVPRENMLDRFASVTPAGVYSSSISSPTKRFFAMIATLVSGRITLTAASTTVSKIALTTAIRYAETRRQFGADGEPEIPILDYQTHQRRLMPRLAATYALDQASKYLVEQYVHGQENPEEADSDHQREVESMAAGFKAWSTWHAMETVQTCRECCGGQGYLAVNRFGRMKDDLDIFTTFEGDNTILMLQVAKALLTEFRQQFAEQGVVGLFQYLTRRAAEAIVDWNPRVVRNTDTDHLRSGDFLKKALRARESHLLSSAARRLKRKVDSGVPPLDAFNNCQDHLVKLAFAHVERRISEIFIESVDKCEQAEARRILRNLSDLFALSRLEADRAWYLENGYFEGSKSKAIRNLVLQLSEEVRLDAEALVDCFDIPDKLISAPIGLGKFPSPPVPQ
jgi:acyl-CoA oxidase